MLSIFFVGVALSMDAFSVAMSLGTLNIPRWKLFLIPLITGMMHFFMPLLGFFLGNKILSLVNISSKLIVSIIFLYLAFTMYLDLKNTKAFKITNLFSIFLFAFSVSIDSFSVGMGINGLTDKYILSFIIFTVCSFSFTYIGLIVGKYSVRILKKKANYLGIIILLGLSVVNLCKILG